MTELSFNLALFSLMLLLFIQTALASTSEAKRSREQR